MLSEVPEGWAIVSLHQIAELSLGKMLDKEKNKGELRPYLANINVRWGGFDLQNLRQMRFEEQEHDRYGLKAGDIVMCEGGEPGRCALWLNGESGIMIQKALHRIRPLEGVDSRYLYFALAQTGASGGFAKHLTGGGIKHLPGEKLRKVEVAAPPLDEQRRIAEVLLSVDTAVLSGLAAVEQADTVHTGLLNALMVSGGESQWPAVKLGELVADSITYGVVQPGAYLDEGVILVRGGDFPSGQIMIEGLPRIAPDVARPYERSTLRGGEILISLVGYPGACALVPEALSGANISRSAALVRPSEEINRDFLYHFIRSPLGQRRVLINSIGSAQQVVNLKDLKEVMVPVPPRSRQDEVASVMNGSMRNVLLAREHLKHLKSLKANIASDLLSGRVRVPA
jgi:type I restriction enzyme S subunit